MAYKKAETNSFAEYQMGEGFGFAVTGQSQTQGIASLAQKNMNKLPAGLQGLSGYEGYPDYLQDMENDLSGLGAHQSGHLGTKELANLIQRNKYDLEMSGSEGIPTCTLQGVEDNAFGNIDDDAFAGYETMGAANIPWIAQESGLDDEDDEDDDDNDDDDDFDGYGGLGDTPLESFHTYFHKATKARSETGLINQLAKAVSVVADDTPMSVKREYYDLAIEMMRRRKTTNLSYLDLQRAEIDSNLGWLINPALPKTGGFGAMLKRAVGSIGSKLGKGEKDQLKAEQDLALGRKLLANVYKSSGLGGFDAFSGGGAKYMGFAAAGLAIVGIIWWYKNRQAAALAAKKKRRRRKRK